MLPEPVAEDGHRVARAVRIVLGGGQYFPPRLLLDPIAAAPSPTGEAAMLTERQRDVLRLLARGLPNKLIARDLGLTEGTVKVHLLAIFRALGARNRTDAVLIAQRLGLPEA